MYTNFYVLVYLRFLFCPELEPPWNAYLPRLDYGDL